MRTRLVRQTACWLLISAGLPSLAGPPRYRIDVEPLPATPVSRGTKCRTSASSTLPGIRIAFATNDCRWTLAEARSGVHVDYVVLVDRDIEGVVPSPPNSGACALPHMSGLTLEQDLQGAPRGACICDGEACPGPLTEPLVLHRGAYPGSFDWNGPEGLVGDGLVPGTYTLTVSASGRRVGVPEPSEFRVESSLTLLVQP